MSDLDFEELDKAINELYESLDEDDGQEPVESNESAAKSESTIDGEQPKSRNLSRRQISGKPGRRAREQRTELTEADDVVADEVVEQPRLTTKGQGHFMDMVHPSSDAQVQHKHNFASERQAELDAKLAEEAAKEDEPTQPSKIAVTVADEPDDEPVQPKSIAIDEADDADDTNDANETKAPVEAVAEKPEATASTESEDSDDSNSTDVIKRDEDEVAKPKAAAPHMAGRRGTQYTSTNRRTGHDLAQPLPVAAAATEPIGDAPAKNTYETPFLPGAKVEKRPLGGGRAVESPIAEYVTGSSRYDRGTDESHSDTESRRSSVPSHIERINSSDDANRHGGANSGRGSANRQSGRTNSRQPATTDGGRGKAMRIAGRILLFLFIIIAGVLTGLAFYYYGG